jgi:hypothetical protein
MKLNRISTLGVVFAAMGASALAQGPDLLTPQNYAAGPAPLGFAVGDVTGDGRPDVLIANSGDGTVRVLQNGSQTAVPLLYFQKDYAAGAGACDVALGDFDQDGFEDFAVANGTDGTVSTFFGDGTAVGFVAGATYPVGIQPCAVTAGDLDGDGYPELVVAEGGTTFESGGVTLLYNDGLGGFGGSLVLSGVGAFNDVRLGDLDGVGGLDVIATDAGGLYPAVTDSAVMVWLNDGAGTFLSPQTWEQDFETGIDGWDVFSDPVWHADRVASGTHGVTSRSGSWHAERDTVFHQNQGGPATNFGSYSAAFPAGGYKTEIAVYLDDALFATNAGDHFEWDSAVSTPQGSHRRDFIFYLGVNTAGDAWSVSCGNGAPGNHEAPGAVSFTGSGWYVLRHDFRDDGTGVLEVVFSVLDPLGNLVAGGDTDPNFVLSNAADVIGSTVGGNRYGWFTQIEFPFLAYDDSSITRYDAYGAPTATGVELKGMELADLDGDGNLDVLAADPGDIYTPGQVHYLPGDGLGGFGAPTAWTSGLTGPMALAVGDLGEDGDLDLVAADAGGDDLTVLLDGMANFGTAYDVASGSLPVAIAVTDLDLDDTPDILVLCTGSDKLYVHPAQPRALVEYFGSGCPGTSGNVPQIAAVGLPTIGNTAFEVEVSNARALSTAVLVFGNDQVEMGVGTLGCTFYVGGDRRQVFAFTDATGAASALTPIPNIWNLEGKNYYAQWVVFDPNGNVGGLYSLSDAMRVKLGY